MLRTLILIQIWIYFFQAEPGSRTSELDPNHWYKHYTLTRIVLFFVCNLVNTWWWYGLIVNPSSPHSAGLVNTASTYGLTLVNSHQDYRGIYFYEAPFIVRHVCNFYDEQNFHFNYCQNNFTSKGEGLQLIKTWAFKGRRL